MISENMLINCWSSYTSTICPASGYMMTSSDGNIFRVTGHLCGEWTGHRWNPRTQWPVTRSFDIFYDLRLINNWVNYREASDLRSVHMETTEHLTWLILFQTARQTEEHFHEWKLEWELNFAADDSHDPWRWACMRRKAYNDDNMCILCTVYIEGQLLHCFPSSTQQFYLLSVISILTAVALYGLASTDNAYAPRWNEATSS